MINPARKPWHVIYDFLQQFGTGGRIFSMMDGLASVGQAALSLGNYEVIAFEKDRLMWKEANAVLVDHIVGLENQHKQYVARISRSVEVQLLTSFTFLDSRNFTSIEERREAIIVRRKSNFPSIHFM